MTDINQAWVSYAPRWRWSVPAHQPRQRVFAVILRADGLADYEVPVSTISIRLRDVRGSYVRVTIPDPVNHAEGIVARTSGRMVICAGELMGDGTRHLEEIIYANVQNLYFDLGRRNVLALAGTRYITQGPGVDAAPAGVWEISKADDGRFSVRAALDFFLKPNDRVTVAGETFVADLISWNITAGNAHMDVEGVA
jgi:hypothetical protein